MSQIDSTGTTTQSTQAAAQTTNNLVLSRVNPMVLKTLIQMLKTLNQTTG
jgi:hypothetical protein